MDKVLLVIGDAAEVFDTLYPLYRVREEGYQVVAAPEKRLYHLVMHDKHPDWDVTVESPGDQLAIERRPRLEDLNAYRVGNPEAWIKTPRWTSASPTPAELRST